MDFFIEPFFYNWLILGAVLLIIEVVSFTLLFFWLAIAAFVMAGISFIIPHMSLTAHLWTFAIVSVVCMVAWHRLFKKNQDSIGDKRMNNRAQRYIGRTADVAQPIINGHGKIRIDDSLWRVECDTDLPVGRTVEVIATDGVVLQVRPKTR
ncbi:MAG: hypothetical protein CSA45_04475 [Gammaproteobacteria bacterium]|nr:MAG: hypothetical protein CSA45_04475 [Gammaproteobacteria bacterium]